MTDLTPKQQRFVEEYLIDLNGTQAAIRAGYSKKTANEQASRLLANVNVSAAVAHAKKTVAEKLGITQERVLLELKRLAFLDIRKTFDQDGNLIPIHQLDDDTAAAIAGLEVERRVSTFVSDEGEPLVESKTHKIKLSDKKAALDTLAKHVGLMSDPSTNFTLNLAGQVNVYLPDNARNKRD